ncbi:MAG: hypothetical protein AAFY52_08555, partial [Pseudomonadota bacterium]
SSTDNATTAFGGTTATIKYGLTAASLSFSDRKTENLFRPSGRLIFPFLTKLLRPSRTQKVALRMHGAHLLKNSLS